MIPAIVPDPHMPFYLCDRAKFEEPGGCECESGLVFSDHPVWHNVWQIKTMGA